MDKGIISVLSVITDEEKQILDGRTVIDRSLYMDGSSDMITGLWKCSRICLCGLALSA